MHCPVPFPPQTLASPRLTTQCTKLLMHVNRVVANIGESMGGHIFV